MDYKYIEQLLERYWECRTSVEEESILRTFFSQKEIPAPLAKYKSLFVYEQRQAHVGLGEDFDQKMLAAVGQTAGCEGRNPLRTKVVRISLGHRLRPLFRAAAVVAITVLVGNAVQHSFTSGASSDPQGWDYDQSAYRDSYSDPQKAYEASTKMLEMFKKGPKTAAVDSTHGKGVQHGFKSVEEE